MPKTGSLGRGKHRNENKKPNTKEELCRKQSRTMMIVPSDKIFIFGVRIVTPKTGPHNDDFAVK